MQRQHRRAHKQLTIFIELHSRPFMLLLYPALLYAVELVLCSDHLPCAAVVDAMLLTLSVLIDIF